MSESRASKTQSNKHWREEFVLKLRLRDVPGPVIGEQLALVDAHLSDSGQSAQQAFGDATKYAESLDLTTEPTSNSALVAIALGAFIGMGLTASAFGALLTGAPVTITVGSAVLALAVCVIVVVAMDVASRIGRFMLCMALMMLFVIGAAILVRFIPTIALVVLPWWLAMICGLALVGSVFYALRRTIGSNRVADPVTGESLI